MTAIIRAVDVSKRFVLHHDKTLKDRVLRIGRSASEDFWALRNINFEIESGTTVGLIGANGSGKTTLLKTVGGILTPTTGFIERRGRIAALLELGAGFHPDLTGRENVYLNASILGLSRKQTDLYFDDIVEFSGIERFIDNQVKFYSSGMYIRLAFAVAVHVEPQVLLVDEVLAVGDEPFQRKCIERITQFQREGRTILFVTHSLEQVRQLCDRVLMLEQGEVLVDGKPREAIAAFRERYAPEMATIDETDPDIRGTGQLEITNVRTAGRDGETRERFESGDDLVIELDLVPHEPIPDPVVGVAIYNHLDMLVFGTNTTIREVGLGLVDRPRRVRFTFPSIPMIDGQYYVSLAVHDRTETVQYHWMERQFSFRVASGSGELGQLVLQTEVEVFDT